MRNYGRRLVAVTLSLLTLICNQVQPVMASSTCDGCGVYKVAEPIQAAGTYKVAEPVQQEKKPVLTPPVPIQRAVNCLQLPMRVYGSGKGVITPIKIKLDNPLGKNVTVYLPEGQMLRALGGTQDMVLRDSQYMNLPANSTDNEMIIRAICASGPDVAPPAADGSPYKVQTLAPADAYLQALIRAAIYQYGHRSYQGLYKNLPQLASEDPVLQQAVDMIRAKYLGKNEPVLQDLLNKVNEQSPELAKLPEDKKKEVNAALAALFDAAKKLAEEVIAISNKLPSFLQTRSDIESYQGWQSQTPSDAQTKAVLKTLDELVNCDRAQFEVRGNVSKSPSSSTVTLTNPFASDLWVNVEDGTILSPPRSAKGFQYMAVTPGKFLYLPASAKRSFELQTKCASGKSLSTPPAASETAVQYGVNNYPLYMTPFYHSLPRLTYAINRALYFDKDGYNGVKPEQIPAMAGGKDYITQWYLWAVRNLAQNDRAKYLTNLLKSPGKLATEVPGYLASAKPKNPEEAKPEVPRYKTTEPLKKPEEAKPEEPRYLTTATPKKPEKAKPEEPQYVASTTPKKPEKAKPEEPQYVASTTPKKPEEAKPEEPRYVASTTPKKPEEAKPEEPRYVTSMTPKKPEEAKPEEPRYVASTTPKKPNEEESSGAPQKPKSPEEEGGGKPGQKPSEEQSGAPAVAPEDLVNRENISNTILKQLNAADRNKPIVQTAMENIFQFVDGASKASFKEQSEEPSVKNAASYSNYIAKANPEQAKADISSEAPKEKEPESERKQAHVYKDTESAESSKSRPEYLVSGPEETKKAKPEKVDNEN